MGLPQLQSKLATPLGSNPGKLSLPLGLWHGLCCGVTWIQGIHFCTQLASLFESQLWLVDRKLGLCAPSPISPRSPVPFPLPMVHGGSTLRSYTDSISDSA